MTFQRMKPVYDKSLAFRLFKRHHTHFNDIFWSHKIARKYVYSQTHPFKRSDPSSKLFSIPGKTRTPPTLGGWSDSYNGFDQWTQMASIMAICGYLETYIAQIATAAVESSPAQILGGGAAIDGAIFLKNNPSYDLYSHIEPLVRGEWQKRISSYKKIFGSCPFESHLSDLEHLRKLRNDTGHSFGRDIKSMKYAPSSMVQELPNINDKKIQEYLRVAESVAESIDKHLFHQFIGSYEAVKLYHHWVSSQSHLTGRPKLLAKAFSVYFNEMTRSPHGKARSLGLVQYYAAL